MSSMETRGGARPNSGPKRGRKNDHIDVFNESKARKEKALADLREMEAKEKAKELLDAAEVREEWGQVVAIAKGRFLAMPSRVSPDVANMTDAKSVEEYILKEVHEILNELASLYGAGS